MTTEQHLIVRSGKSEAYLTNTVPERLSSKYYTVEAILSDTNHRATAELRVLLGFVRDFWRYINLTDCLIN